MSQSNRGQINYDNRIFRSVANTPNGEVGGETLFHYRQQGDLVWGTYEGGGVIGGHLIANVGADGALYMRYHHRSPTGALMTGLCRSPRDPRRRPLPPPRGLAMDQRRQQPRPKHDRGS